MPIDQQISEKTHQVLSEEFENYDPEAVQEAADEWVENAPGPCEDADRTSFEVVETESGSWKWELTDADGSIIASSRRTFERREATFDAATAFQHSIGTAPIVADDSS